MMVCPKCGAEYRDGFYLCADCHVPLVLPGPEPDWDHGTSDSVAMHSEQDLEQVLDSKDSVFMAEVVAALERAGIPYLLQSGTAFEHARRLVGRRRPQDWHAVLYVVTGFDDQFAEILDQIKSRPLADERAGDYSE